MSDPLREMVERLGCPIVVCTDRDEPDIIELHQQGHPGATGSVACALASPRVILRYDHVDVVTFNDKEEKYDLRIRLTVAANDLWMSIAERQAKDGCLRVGDNRYPAVIRDLAQN